MHYYPSISGSFSITCAYLGLTLMGCLALYGFRYARLCETVAKKLEQDREGKELLAKSGGQAAAAAAVIPEVPRRRSVVEKSLSKVKSSASKLKSLVLDANADLWMEKLQKEATLKAKAFDASADVAAAEQQSGTPDDAAKCCASLCQDGPRFFWRRAYRRLLVSFFGAWDSEGNQAQGRAYWAPYFENMFKLIETIKGVTVFLLTISPSTMLAYNCSKNNVLFDFFKDSDDAYLQNEKIPCPKSEETLFNALVASKSSNYYPEYTFAEVTKGRCASILLPPNYIYLGVLLLLESITLLIFLALGADGLFKNFKKAAGSLFASAILWGSWPFLLNYDYCENYTCGYDVTGGTCFVSYVALTTGVFSLWYSVAAFAVCTAGRLAPPAAESEEDAMVQKLVTNLARMKALHRKAAREEQLYGSVTATTAQMLLDAQSSQSEIYGHLQAPPAPDNGVSPIGDIARNNRAPSFKPAPVVSVAPSRSTAVATTSDESRTTTGRPRTNTSASAPSPPPAQPQAVFVPAEGAARRTTSVTNRPLPPPPPPAASDLPPAAPEVSLRRPSAARARAPPIPQSLPGVVHIDADSDLANYGFDVANTVVDE